MLIRARRYGTQKGKQNDPCAFKIKHYQHRKSTSHKHIHETPKTIYKIKKKRGGARIGRKGIHNQTSSNNVTGSGYAYIPAEIPLQ